VNLGNEKHTLVEPSSSGSSRMFVFIRLAKVGVSRQESGGGGLSQGWHKFPLVKSSQREGKDGAKGSWFLVAFPAEIQKRQSAIPPPAHAIRFVGWSIENIDACWKSIIDVHLIHFCTLVHTSNHPFSVIESLSLSTFLKGSRGF
jgi:hypothetical protein